MRVRSLSSQQYARSAECLAPEPAELNYWLDKGFVDLGATIRESLTMDLGAVLSLLSTMSGKVKATSSIIFKIIFIVFYLASAASVLVFGTIVTLLLSFVHSLVIFAVMAAMYVLLGIAKAADAAYRRALKVSFACDQCRNIFRQPGYVCPSCGRLHARLRPNVYGIFYHRCICGQTLPSTFFSVTKGPSGETLRRTSLEQRCPNPRCARHLGAGEARTVSVSVVGSRSVGKTTYLAALAHLLVDVLPGTSGYSTSFLDDEKEKMFLDLERDYSNDLIEMTKESADLDAPSAFSLSFYVEKPGMNPNRLLHLYDVAGETFFKSEEHEAQLQYAYGDGVVLLVDPLSIPDVADEILDDLPAKDSAVAAREHPDTVLSNFIGKVRHVSRISQKERISLPVAVVLNKADLPGLREYFSKVSRSIYRGQNPDCPECDVDDALVREFLLSHDMGNFLATLESNFKTYRFFSVSSSRPKRTTSSGPAEEPSERLGTPFAWLMACSDPTLANELGLEPELVSEAGNAPYAAGGKKRGRGSK